MPEYTVLTVVSVVAVVALELLWLRTGLFRRAQYWIAMAIIFAFQTLVDGWLTKLSDPIVQYAPEQMLGIRAPWDIPIEDFGFGFSMVTLTLLLWVRLNRRAEARRSGTAPTEQRPTEQPRPEMTRPDATRVDDR
ncbi:lycopene cyclase domain-containing protein [Raineyella antarctica]|uniref:Lycopene cyclase domain-containing protein n=1 Tax=Raineyella antarctica TaxID=1577474 RepID=A0A1G6IKY0_9ACTN|nr:lycopene cyclase domain-containing protein [Raineyella antarctica]SDC07124.1 lycopene cyclase domain-containing protein [Raineyella antarctica]